MIEGEFRRARPTPDGPPILTGIAADEAEALAALVRPGARVLEVGTALGYSAILLARHGATVLSVDDYSGRERDVGKRAARNVAAHGLAARVFLARADSLLLLPYLYSLGARFNGVFVDGGSAQTGSDIDHGWRMLKRGGWLARHDYREKGSPNTTTALDAFGQPDAVTRTLWVKQKP